MKVKDLMRMLKGYNPEAEVQIITMNKKMKASYYQFDILGCDGKGKDPKAAQKKAKHVFIPAY